ACLDLPQGLILPEEAPLVVEVARTTRGLRPRGLLLAEGDRMMRQAAERLLSRAGYRVFPAADGEEALEVFLAHRDEIDLLILAEALAQRGGVEALRAARAISPGVRALLLGGVAGGADRAEGIVARLGR